MSARLAKQLALIGLAASLWSAAGNASSLALLVAYLLAWSCCELPPVRGWMRAAPPGVLALLAVVLLAPGLAFGYRTRAELLVNEGLLGAGARLGDRLRLHATPTIAPPLLAADRPQTWFVSAPGTQRMELRVAGVRVLPAEALGSGLFRIDYDPRRDGLPSSAAPELEVELVGDGHAHTRTLEQVRPLAHPRWFCLARDRSRAATVSEETDELFVLDASGVQRRLNVGDGPVDCAFDDEGHVLLSHRNQSTLVLWDLTTGKQAGTLELGARQGRLARSPSGNLVAVALAGVKPALAVVSLRPLSLLTRAPLAQAADWLAFGQDDQTLFASTRTGATLRRLRARDGAFSEDAVLELGRPAVTLLRSADGQQLWAATTDLHAKGHAQLGNHFVQDQLLLIDTERMQVSARQFTARRSDRQSKPGDVDRGCSPMGIELAQGGGLWLSMAGSDEVWRWQPDDVAPHTVDLGDLELYAPHGVAELADGTLLISSPAAGAFGVLAKNASAVRRVPVTPQTSWLAAHDRAALARRVGERDFYEATRSGISCQSCHMHADSDEAAYNLGDHRLLPTLSVRGVTRTAPYLRDGSYPRLRDLEEVAQTLYRGYLRNQAARGEALEAFVSSLARRDAQRTRDAAAERRGFAAFNKASCASCHAPPAFTNLAQIPLRTLFPEQAATLEQEETLDTPSLLSVAASAPYLNDGRAASLEAVLVEHNRANLHGDVKRLSADERRDLLAFLSSL
ncbi:MAG TPA: hypothetical protein VJV78_11045 [Polyangiales bacterium]|nr:hypothetical protein [Polyangiales bacterium]